jgi:hypothetical protein
MSPFPVVSLPPFVLQNEDFPTPILSNYLADHFGPLHIGLAYAYALTVGGQENFLKSYGITDRHRDPFQVYLIPFGNPVLLSATLKDCVHGIDP